MSEEQKKQAESLTRELDKLPQDAREKKPLNSGRRDILHLLCGGYLLYLAYKLATSFIADFPQNG